ncbi:Shedu immune nuclease family protein [Acinetobacter bereziniae]|uniref:Shedu immune nuclease family protein n=1 Tax=Acinetobacter bereziniae TaxID=106648 RepID=UPI002251F9C0|nr:Shedu immune nuclease family protein [Acinetobacter bereziniae]
MIEFLKDKTLLFLIYEPESNDVSWVDEKLSSTGSVTINRVFSFSKLDKFNEEDQCIKFVFGNLNDDYYTIDRDILGISHDLLIYKDFNFTKKNFIASYNISIFRKIDDALNGKEIIIGGEKEDAISIEDFNNLIKNFPNTTELKYYSRIRILREINDYFGGLSEAEKRLKSNLENRIVRRESDNSSYIRDTFKGYEIKKYEFIYDELIEMLNEAESYSENVWQDKILDLLLLIFPKYIKVIKELNVKDFYTDSKRDITRKIDFSLIDCNGNIDIVEIKKPFEKAILTSRLYRDNYVPKNELSGSIVQVEKYIFHLNKWGASGERTINDKYKDKLPSGLSIKVVNPKAMIILGRDNNFSDKHKFDFEFIRRKYSNVLDIMTYDDLLRRVENIISMLRSNQNNQ